MGKKKIDSDVRRRFGFCCSVTITVVDNFDIASNASAAKAQQVDRMDQYFIRGFWVNKI